MQSGSEERVVALVDGTGDDATILAAAAGFARLLDLPVRAVHVRDPAHPNKPAPLLAQIELQVIDGEPMTSLVAAVDSPQVRLAVLGARHRPDDPRPAGRVAEAVLAATSKPVLVIGPSCQLPRDKTYRRVLVPLNGSTRSADAARETLDLFSTKGLDVIALHVFDQQTVPSFFDQPQHDLPRFIENFLGRHGGAPTARLTLATDPTASAVVAAVTSEHADLLVLSWSQDLDPDHAHVIRHALQNCPVPILLLPPQPPAESAADR